MSLVEAAGPVTCIRLKGRLDAQGADAIGVRFTAAVAAQGRDSVIDLSEVSFVASMGLRLLISAARALALKQGRMVLCGARGMVLEVFEDAGLEQLIPLADDEEAALAQLAA